MEADGLRRLALKIPTHATHTSARPRSIFGPKVTARKTAAEMGRTRTGFSAGASPFGYATKQPPPTTTNPQA